MKKIFYTLLILTSPLLLSAGIVEKTYYFNDPDVRNAGQHQMISFDNTWITGIPGQPALPYQAISLLLPPGEMAESIEIIVKNEIVIPGYYTLYPQQHSRPLSEEASGDFIKDSTVYQSENPYPASPQGNLSTHFMNGYAVALCAFTPVKYIPASGAISYYQEVTVRIKTKPDARANEVLQKLSSSPSVLDRIHNFIQNKKIVSMYPRPETRDDEYQILIITSMQLENGFEDLENLYLKRGMISQLVNTDYINMNISGQDLPEKIRNYIIQEYQDHGIEYVVLGGDIEHVPYRGFYCYVESGWGYEEYNIPADLYYSALDGTWNNNGNNKWGEPGEDDLLPDIAVARLTVSNMTELENMIHKSCAYQDTPVTGELRDPILAGEHLWYDPETWGGDYLDLLIGFHDDNGYETTGIPEEHNILKMYERDGSWSSYDLIDAINEGTQFVHHSGHSNTSYAMKLYTSDITNSNFYAANGEDHNYTLVYTHGCNCGGFDESDCIAETMVCIENFAVAGAFNSRYGWFNEGQTEGPSEHLHREFLDALYHQKEGRIGSTHMISKIETSPWVTAPGQHEEGALRWCFYDCNILGDPALSIWTDELIDIEVDYPGTLQAGATSMAVTVTSNGMPVDNMHCALMADGVLAGAGITDSTGQTLIPIGNGLNGTEEAELVVSGYNCMPHYYPVSILVGIDDISYDKFHVRIFPNPATNHFSLVMLPEKIQTVSVSVSGIIGNQLIYESDIEIYPGQENLITIDSKDWIPGIYICRIKSLSTESVFKVILNQ